VKHEEKIDFVNMMSGVAEIYGKKMSETLLDVYWFTLEKYEFEQIKTSIGMHMSNPDTGQFMPKPADFIRYIEGKSQDRALFAWKKLIQAVKQWGSYQSIVFDDPLIHHVVDEMGGWILFCRSEEAKLPFLFQDFSRHYVACLTRSMQDYPKQLTGITEHLNVLYGYHIETPVFCDDTHKLNYVKTLKEGTHEKAEQRERFGEDEGAKKIKKTENIGEVAES
jgi:hypothetical protein